jgi:hypothetical protein
MQSSQKSLRDSIPFFPNHKVPLSQFRCAVLPTAPALSIHPIAVGEGVSSCGVYPQPQPHQLPRTDAPERLQETGVENWKWLSVVT